MADYYDWGKTLSFDAPFNLVLTARGRGKTYGLRKQCIRDFIKGGWRFVEICRYKTELPTVVAGYFDRVGNDPEFEGYVFRSEGKFGYIARRPENDDDKPDWQPLVYFCSLSEQQQLKKRTFDRVRRVIFDEAILDINDKNHSYLYREYDQLVNLIDTIARQRPGEDTPVRVYLLGNACDLVNPYFQAFHIYREPSFGFHRYLGGDVLVHYEDPGEYATGKMQGTLVGRLASVTSEAVVIASNRFAAGGTSLVAKKPAAAKFEYGIKFEDQRFGIWYDWGGGRVYVNRQIPNNAAPVYALTTADNDVNLVMAKRTERVLKSFAELYYAGVVRFDTPATRERFTKILSLLGIR